MKACICVSVSCMCLVPTGARRGHWTPQTGVIRCDHLIRGLGRAPTSARATELLTAEPSLQTLNQDSQLAQMMLWPWKGSQHPGRTSCGFLGSLLAVNMYKASHKESCMATPKTLHMAAALCGYQAWDSLGAKFPLLCSRPAVPSPDCIF